ncbi:hypothetical protein GE09DRAFT_528409 [Coniochaeta sp. 2T2.1]|nr:hypothetical protein GE09DRAFT_528409 [Coniochaeta sp. 2T2.1]
MTEPENIEDDLFADLYDDEPAAQPQAAPDQSTSEQAPAADDSYNPELDSNQQYDAQNGDDQDMNQGDAGEDDDDDEVDFNLGNNNNNARHEQDHDNDHDNGPQGYGIPQQQHHGHRGPNSKEDGTAVSWRLWPRARL